MKLRLRILAGVAALTLLSNSIVKAQDVLATIVGTGLFNSSDLSFGGDAIGSNWGGSFAGNTMLSPNPIGDRFKNSRRIVPLS